MRLHITLFVVMAVLCCMAAAALWSPVVDEGASHYTVRGRVEFNVGKGCTGAPTAGVCRTPAQGAEFEDAVAAILLANANSLDCKLVLHYTDLGPLANAIQGPLIAAAASHPVWERVFPLPDGDKDGNPDELYLTMVDCPYHISVDGRPWQPASTVASSYNRLQQTSVVLKQKKTALHAPLTPAPTTATPTGAPTATQQPSSPLRAYAPLDSIMIREVSPLLDEINRKFLSPAGARSAAARQLYPLPDNMVVITEYKIGQGCNTTYTGSDNCFATMQAAEDALATVRMANVGREECSISRLNRFVGAVAFAQAIAPADVTYAHPDTGVPTTVPWTTVWGTELPTISTTLITVCPFRISGPDSDWNVDSVTTLMRSELGYKVDQYLVKGTVEH